MVAQLVDPSKRSSVVIVSICGVSLYVKFLSRFIASRLFKSLTFLIEIDTKEKHSLYVLC